MKQIVYTVQAYRFGDKNAHSYIVGVYSKNMQVVEITAMFTGSEHALCTDGKGGKI